MAVEIRLGMSSNNLRIRFSDTIFALRYLKHKYKVGRRNSKMYINSNSQPLFIPIVGHLYM